MYVCICIYIYMNIMIMLIHKLGKNNRERTLIFLAQLKTQRAIAFLCVWKESLWLLFWGKSQLHCVTLLFVVVQNCDLSNLSSIWHDVEIVSNSYWTIPYDACLTKAIGTRIMFIPKDTFRWWQVAIENSSFRGDFPIATYNLGQDFQLPDYRRVSHVKTWANHQPNIFLTLCMQMFLGHILFKGASASIVFRYVQLMDESPWARCAPRLQGQAWQRRLTCRCLLQCRVSPMPWEGSEPMIKNNHHNDNSNDNDNSSNNTNW